MAIQTGIDNSHLGVSVVAGNEECYQVFKDLCDSVLKDGMDINQKISNKPIWM
ncbi:putative ATP:guanido phosphotransferase [Plasmopara halstedii]